MVALRLSDRQRAAVAIVGRGGARLKVAIRVHGFRRVGGGESHRHLVYQAFIHRDGFRLVGHIGHDYRRDRAAGSWTAVHRRWCRGRRCRRRRRGGRRRRRRGVGVGPPDLDSAVWVRGAVQLLRHHALDDRDHHVSVLRSVSVTAAKRKRGGDGVDLHNPSPLCKRRKRGQARRGHRGRRPQLQSPAVVAVVAGIAPRTGKAIGVPAFSGAADVGEYGAWGKTVYTAAGNRHLLKVGVHLAVELLSLAHCIPRVSSLATIGATVSALTVKERVTFAPGAVRAVEVRGVERTCGLVEVAAQAGRVSSHIKPPIRQAWLQCTDCPRQTLSLNRSLCLIVPPVSLFRRLHLHLHVLVRGNAIQIPAW